MKKNIYFALLTGAVLLIGMNTSAKVSSRQELSRKVPQKVETAANNHQVTLFMEQLAKKDPAKLANFLLDGKFAYVYNETVKYIGIRGTDEVLVICQINDSDVGTFYYAAHKKGNKLNEQSTATPPSTQDFITLFERK